MKHLFYLEKSVRRRLLRLFAAAGLPCSGRVCGVSSSPDVHSRTTRTVTTAARCSPARCRPACRLCGRAPRPGRLPAVPGALRQQFGQAGNLRRHPRWRSPARPAVDGVHRVHRRVIAQQVLFRQFQRDRHILLRSGRRPAAASRRGRRPSPCPACCRRPPPPAPGHALPPGRSV